MMVNELAVIPTNQHSLVTNERPVLRVVEVEDTETIAVVEPSDGLVRIDQRGPFSSVSKVVELDERRGDASCRDRGVLERHPEKLAQQAEAALGGDLRLGDAAQRT